MPYFLVHFFLHPQCICFNLSPTLFWYITNSRHLLLSSTKHLFCLSFVKSPQFFFASCPQLKASIFSWPHVGPVTQVGPIWHSLQHGGRLTTEVLTLLILIVAPWRLFHSVYSLEPRAVSKDPYKTLLTICLLLNILTLILAICA